MTLQWDIIKKIRFCFGYGIVRFSKANYVRSLVECSASSVCLRICRQIALITDCFWFLTSAYDESKIPSDPVTMSWRIFRCLYQRAFINISIANPPEWDGNRWRALFPRYCDSFFRCSLTILLDRERYSQRKLSSPPLYENTATLIQAKARTKTSAPIILLVPSHVKREWKYVRTGGLVNRERSGEECSTLRVLTDLFSYSPISFSALYTKWILFRRLSKREAGNWRKKQTKKEYTLKNHYVHSRLKQERHEVDRTQTWRWLKNLLLKQKLCQWMYLFKCLNLSSKASSPEVSYPSFSRTSTEFHWVKFTELHDNAITNNSILFRRNLSTFNPNLGKLFSSIYSRLSPLKMLGGLSC